MTKLHIGCGKRYFGSDWYHIDGGNFSHVDSHDVEELTEFSNNHVDLIYSAHMIEYFDRQRGKEILKNWFNKIKPGGVLRLAVPDFYAMCYLYCNKKAQLKDLLGPLYGKIQLNQEYVYHKTTYDFHDLSEILREIGFIKVRRYDFKTTEHNHIDDHSQAHFPHDPEAIKTGVFTDKHTLISLNIEAVKP